jgi:phospholipid transport system substrate-binding protein
MRMLVRWKFSQVLMVLGFACALIYSARAADPEADGRAIVQSMGDALLATLRAGSDKATREARFGEMYRRNFDNAVLGSWAAGRAYTAASPEQRQQFLQLFETYVIKSYSVLIQQYKGERLRVEKSESDGRYIVVISKLVPPDPSDPREIEMKWRMQFAGDRLVVTDVVIDKISMALTEKRAFTEWLQERGGTLEGLMGKLREKITRVDGTSS